MAEAEVSLIPGSIPTGEQMVEWDRRTIKRLKNLGWWVLVVFVGAAFIMAIIALVKLNSAPEAVASYVETVSTGLLGEIEETFTNLTIRVMTLEAQLAAMQNNCVCVPIIVAPPTPPPSPSSKRRAATLPRSVEWTTRDENVRHTMERLREMYNELPHNISKIKQ